MTASCPDLSPHWHLYADFCSTGTANHIVRVLSAESYGSKWVSLRHRSVLQFGGQPDEHLGMLASPLPSFLGGIVSDIADAKLLPGGRPNHCLVNRYGCGAGIDGHEDGPLYEPVVCILSIGAPVVFRFSPKAQVPQDPTTGTADLSVLLPSRSLFSPKAQVPQDPTTGTADLSVLLPSRSLLSFSGPLYTDYLHSIAHLTSPLQMSESPVFVGSGPALREARGSVSCCDGHLYGEPCGAALAEQYVGFVGSDAPAVDRRLRSTDVVARYDDAFGCARYSLTFRVVNRVIKRVR